MCGRYTLAANADELVEAFDVPLPAFELVARYNIAPSQLAPVVAADRHGRRLGLLTWGLVPGWADEPGEGIINARIESVAEKPSFREALDRRRCLVPADGFYEWKGVNGGKVPHWIHPASGGVISFAGIWERWSRPGAAARHTFAILTTEANADVAPLHDRMPVIVTAESRDAWLDRDLDGAEALELLRPTPRGALTSFAVSPRVNRATEDDEDLVRPAGEVVR
ncbi:MAG: SOS response-associated peptidase [Longimicrobiales bacterium]